MWPVATAWHRGQQHLTESPPEESLSPAGLMTGLSCSKGVERGHCRGGLARLGGFPSHVKLPLWGSGASAGTATHSTGALAGSPALRDVEMQPDDDDEILWTREVQHV